jgi:dihydrofolate synthase / folylpolyglutamate synthase
MTNAMPASLDEWLAYIERVHPQSIAMGLDRVGAVRRALGLDPGFPIISVGGTNGKGSACAMLEAMLVAAGYQVGCYTSPHLLRYNERVRIGGREVDDAQLTAAFAAVDAARGGTQLTYFEFGTLAAVWLFVKAGIDAAVLEVGLGGRLDAVNVFDADSALVTSVALDHMDYLGATREEIGFEKAGIFRSGRPAVCADPDPPGSLVAHAAAIGAPVWLTGRDFGFEAERTQWRYWGPHGRRAGLPQPALRGSFQIANAAACLATLDTVRDRLPVAMNHIRSGLVEVEAPARFQVLPGRPLVILDVAHNPHAAAALSANLAAMGRSGGRTLAVFSMYKDKDIAGVARAVRSHVDHWFIAPSPGARGAGAAALARHLAAAGVDAPITACEDTAAAYGQACDQAGENDRILAFGSFLTVAAVMRARARHALHERAGHV